MCLNKKVLIGVGLVAAGVVLFAPQLISAALPLLLVAICPLSMLLMMKGMSGMGQSHGQSKTAQAGDAASGQAAPAMAAPGGGSADPSTAELQDKLRALQAQQVALEDQLRAHQSAR
jgi:UPF0716 family protein affecting phage T7 exclusion